MRILLAAVVLLAALAAVPGAGAERLRYGVADDWPKFHPCGDAWWSSAAEIGYRDLRMTVQWDADAPTVIPFQAELQLATDCAVLNDIRPILAIYPSKPGAVGSSELSQAAFASFVGLVGQAFPEVHDFVVGNEPNVNRFWQPQYAAGRDAAAADYEHTLARSYDALKLVRPDSVVWGPAISSRGNDNPAAVSNPSHSPVWFIKEMGDAYRGSGRKLRIFDEFDMHPYPPTQDTDPFSKPFQWPQAGAADLDRIKQALWDAFHGTGQPTVTEGAFVRTAPFAAPQALPIDLDEAGEQTTVPVREGVAYDGTLENVAAISETEQASNHVELTEIAACDPSVRSLMFFPLIDDSGISSGFQSGNLYADLAEKQSFEALKAKISSANGLCEGGDAGISASWTHTAKVLGAAGSFGRPGASLGSQPERRPASAKLWAFSFTASEDTSYQATLCRVSRAGGLPRTVLAVSGTAKAYLRPRVRFDTRRLEPGYYAYRVALTATTNPKRTSLLISKPFEVGSTGPPRRRSRPG